MDLAPLPESQWSLLHATHLLNRAGFGGPPSQIEKLHALGLKGAVESLIDAPLSLDPHPPSCSKPDPTLFKQLREAQMARKQGDAEARLKFQQLIRTVTLQSRELRAWWLDRFLQVPDVFREKITLFWHGHFATSLQKVRNPYFMARQNDLFRRLGLGTWQELLTEVAKDPAMLIWLDGNHSRKDHPNENFAREVMELFTLGEGHYTEKDIQEAARAFTGWTVDPVNQTYRFAKIRHDDGPKTVLGKTGPFKGEDVLALLAGQPQSAKFLWIKLWRFFVNDEEPSPALLKAIVRTFEENGHAFQPTLKTLFLSAAFYAPENQRCLVKSPVQWLVGSVRHLEREAPPVQPSLNALRLLGQELLAPPNVKGWDGGISWVTTNNLLYRYNFSWFLLNGAKPPKLGDSGQKGDKLRERLGDMEGATYPPLDPTPLFASSDLESSESILAAIEKRLLSVPLKASRRQPVLDYLNSKTKQTPETLRNALRLVMSTPDYQLC